MTAIDKAFESIRANSVACSSKYLTSINKTWKKIDKKLYINGFNITPVLKPNKTRDGTEKAI